MNNAQTTLSIIAALLVIVGSQTYLIMGRLSDITSRLDRIEDRLLNHITDTKLHNT